MRLEFNGWVSTSRMCIKRECLAVWGWNKTYYAYSLENVAFVVVSCFSVCTWWAFLYKESEVKRRRRRRTTFKQKLPLGTEGSDPLSSSHRTDQWRNRLPWTWQLEKEVRVQIKCSKAFICHEYLVFRVSYLHPRIQPWSPCLILAVAWSHSPSTSSPISRLQEPYSNYKNYKSDPTGTSILGNICQVFCRNFLFSTTFVEFWLNLPTFGYSCSHFLVKCPEFRQNLPTFGNIRSHYWQICWITLRFVYLWQHWFTF
jgi:hypothetical protein